MRFLSLENSQLNCRLTAIPLCLVRRLVIAKGFFVPDQKTIEENRKKIDANRWRQGSTLKYDSVSKVVKTTTSKVEKKGKAILLVISQSCDVLNGDTNQCENIECLIIRPVNRPGPHPNLANGKNPRKLQIQYDQQTYEVLAKEVCFLPKSYLVENEASNVVCNSADMAAQDWRIFMTSLRSFWVNKFTRTGLPERFAAQTRSILDSEEMCNALEAFHPFLDRLYIRLTPFAESEEYSVAFIALVLEGEDHPNTKVTDLKDHTDDLERFLEEKIFDPLNAISGIAVQNNTDFFELQGLENLMNKNDFSIGLLDTFFPYYYDSVSLAAQGDNDE